MGCTHSRVKEHADQPCVKLSSPFTSNGNTQSHAPQPGKASSKINDLDVIHPIVTSDQVQLAAAGRPVQQPLPSQSASSDMRNGHQYQGQQLHGDSIASIQEPSQQQQQQQLPSGAQTKSPKQLNGTMDTQGAGSCAAPAATQQQQQNSAEATSRQEELPDMTWRPPETPADEDMRYAGLCSYDILDTEREEAYDCITALCKTLFQVPISMVTFVDRDRVWLKSVTGLEGLQEVDRRASLCAWTLVSRFPETMVVEDLLEDVRFKNYPVVTGPLALRFYAASPLVTAEGQRLGTLCLLDNKPRRFSAEKASLLAQLAAMVMKEVERKRAMNQVLCSSAVRQGGDCIAHDRQGIMLVDVGNPKWTIHLVNDAWQRALGIAQQMACGAHFWDMFEKPVANQMAAVLLACEQKRNFELRVPLCLVSGSSSRNSGSSTSYVYAGHSMGYVDGFSGSPALDSSHHAHRQQQQQQLGKHCSGYTQSLDLDSHSSGGSGSGRLPQQVASNTPSGLLPPVAAPGRPSISRMSASSAHGLGALVSQSAGRTCLRFQFRSALGANPLFATPSISIPPMLLDSASPGQNYYWATIEVPQEEAPSNSSCEALYRSGALALSARAASEQGSGGSSGDPLTEPSTPPKTTFNLLPEENPFADITIGILLGWGSYGRVHRGYWNGTLVAVKVLEQIAGDVNPRTTLEPLLHHRLSHPNVVKMYDISTQEVDVCEDGRPLQEVWMVLEFCNRGTLSEAIARGALLLADSQGPVTGAVHLQRVLNTAADIVAAMTYLHKQNVLHGDLNGNNILLVGASQRAGDDRGFLAKVADFGLSRMLAPDNDKIITRTHGTITHMAPEVIVESTHSKAADVYSFGVVLWEMLTSKRVYHGMHCAQIVHSITMGQPLEVPSDVPAVLRQLLQDCLSRRPQDRPTFQQILEQLKRPEMQELMGSTAAPPGPPGAAAAAAAAGAAALQ